MEIKQKEFESYWCKKDVARILSVSTRKIEKMMEDGLIPYLKIGGSVRFIPEKVREFVETNFIPNTEKDRGISIGSSLPSAVTQVSKNEKYPGGVQKYLCWHCGKWKQEEYGQNAYKPDFRWLVKLHQLCAFAE
jgi:excisionase family DNA binding protein